MNVHDLVDELYEVFADGIGGPLGESARDLPRALSLAPAAVPWSRVFSHEVTLGAPALFAEAMPTLDRNLLREAMLAHVLSVVDAFGTDRIEDEQVTASPVIFAVLGRARLERDRALARLFAGRVRPSGCDFRAADLVTAQALKSERSTLLSGRPADIDAYEAASIEKQRAGIIASLALAHAAGWAPLRCDSVQFTLESVALALQMHDDVVDWESDLQRGGAWAICLMRGQGNSAEIDRRMPIRKQVHDSGILGVMLSRACIHMRRARRRATALGARRLAGWASGQERRLQSLAAAEIKSAGYAVRAGALAAWASEVLG
jgi:hypothetical protein